MQKPGLAQLQKELTRAASRGGKRALLQQPGSGRCADRITADQPEHDCGRRGRRQTVQPRERPRGQSSERIGESRAHEQRAGEEKREQRGQRGLRRKRQPVAHPIGARGRAEQKRCKQRKR